MAIQNVAKLTPQGPICRCHPDASMEVAIGQDNASFAHSSKMVDRDPGWHNDMGLPLAQEGKAVTSCSHGYYASTVSLILGHSCNSGCLPSLPPQFILHAHCRIRRQMRFLPKNEICRPGIRGAQKPRQGCEGSGIDSDACPGVFPFATPPSFSHALHERFA